MDGKTNRSAIWGGLTLGLIVGLIVGLASDNLLGSVILGGVIGWGAGIVAKYLGVWSDSMKS